MSNLWFNYIYDQQRDHKPEEVDPGPWYQQSAHTGRTWRSDDGVRWREVHRADG